MYAILEKLKIAKIESLFKTGKKELLTIYMPISVPYLSNIIERIMFNRLYSCLNQNNILYNKKLRFRGGHSIDHLLIELVDIYDPLTKINVFIDFPKAFDAAYQETLLKRIQLYGVQGNLFKWFESYLSNRKQYIDVEE